MLRAGIPHIASRDTVFFFCESREILEKSPILRKKVAKVGKSEDVASASATNYLFHSKFVI